MNSVWKGVGSDKDVRDCTRRKPHVELRRPAEAIRSQGLDSSRLLGPGSI